MMQGVVAAEGTGGNPNFLGDKNSQGQYTAGGIGSWSNENAQGIPQALSSGGIPSNFQTQASALGLNPDNFSIDNQNQVLYGTLAQDKAQGLTPAQSLSKWNSGDPNAYQTSPVESSSVSSTGTSNVAAYVQRGLTAAQKYAQSQGKVAGASTSQGQGTASQFQGQTNAAGVSGIPSTPFQGSAPGGILGNVGANLQALPSQAAGAGNALFPVAGDAGAMLQGQPTGKSAEQIGGDVLKTGTTIGAVASIPFSGGLDIPALMGMSAGLGAAQSAGGAMQQNAPATQVAGQGTIGGAIGAGTAGILSGVTSALSSLAGQSVNMALRPTAADLSDGYSSSFAVKNGLTGSAKQVAAKAGAFIQGLTKQLTTALGSSDASINLPAVFDQTKSELGSQQSLESNFLQNTGIQGALNKVEGEIKMVSASNAGQLPMLAAQRIKQAVGMYGEWVNGVPDQDANAMGTVANALYRNMKTSIEDAVPNEDVEAINKQIQKTIPIMRAAIRRIPVAARASAISLTDMLSFLGLSINAPAAVGADVIQRSMSSGLASNVLPAIAGKIPSITPALSTAAPAIAGYARGLLPQQ